MAGVTFTKKNVARMIETLDEDHADIEGAARAALDTAMELVAERAKFAVVGQVYYSNEHGKIEPGHEDAVKVMLDMYDSDTKANDAARDWSTSTSNGDRLATWVVPIHWGTPSSWHKDRKDAYKLLQSKADEKRKAKFVKSIADHREKMLGRAEEIKEWERRAGQSWPCAPIDRPNCRHDPKCR